MTLSEPRFTIPQAAAHAGVHRNTLDRWARVGVRGHKLPTVRVGGWRYVLASDLDAFLNALQGPGDNANGITSHQP